MKKRILSLAMVLALLAVLVMPMAALATNTGTQGASTLKADTINIVGKTATSVAAVSTITFPAGLPGAVISTPSSNAAGSGEGTPQVLGAASEPVVQLLNTTAGSFIVWLGITAWTTDGAVASERYELVATTVTNQATVAGVLSPTGGAANVNAGTIAGNTYKALYLEVTLSALAGKTGSTSTITILGETS